MNPCLHGNGEGIVDDDNQRNGGHCRDEKKHGKQQPWSRVLRAAHEIQSQQRVMIRDGLRRRAHCCGNLRRVLKNRAVILEIELQRRLTLLRGGLQHSVLDSGEAFCGFGILRIKRTGNPALPAAFVQTDALRLVLPGVIKQAAQKREQKRGNKRRRQSRDAGSAVVLQDRSAPPSCGGKWRLACGSASRDPFRRP